MGQPGLSTHFGRMQDYCCSEERRGPPKAALGAGGCSTSAKKLMLQIHMESGSGTLLLQPGYPGDLCFEWQERQMKVHVCDIHAKPRLCGDDAVRPGAS